MSKYIALILALLFVTPLISVALPTEPNYSSPQVISSIPYFQHLEYIVSVYNQTKISNTTKTIVIANYTATYNVINVNNGNAVVNVNVTPIYEPKNFTFGLLKSGNYTVNLIEDILSIHYPYIYQGYLFQSTYQLVFPHMSIYISYQNSTKVNINGVNYTAYEYINFSSFILLQQHFYVLNNGIGYSFNTSYAYQVRNGTQSTLTVNFHLVNLSNQQNSTLQGAPEAFIRNAERAYQYVWYNYSYISKSLQPITYIQAYYPLIFTNGYLAAEEIELSFYAGARLNQFSIFSLNIGNLTTIPLTFIINTNSSEITWGGQSFHKIGTTTLEIFGINYTVTEYQNISSGKYVTLLYFDNNGTLIERAQGITNGTSVQITSELLYTPQVIPPNSTYLSYIQYATTGTLPFKVISPAYSLAITIIITLVIVAIIVLLYKR